MNHTLETHLLYFTSEQQRVRNFFLTWAECLYNTNFHGTAGCTPFKVVYVAAHLQKFVVARDLIYRNEGLHQVINLNIIWQGNKSL